MRTINYFFLAIVLSFLMGGCISRSVVGTPSSTLISGGKAPLGSRENPVKCSMPTGQREYIMRLRCKNGDEPLFERKGNAGRGPHGNFIDIYEVYCKKDRSKTIFYMDMYHSGYREMETIEGFVLHKELPARLAIGCPPKVPGVKQGSYIFRELEVEKPVHLLNELPDTVNVGEKGTAAVQVIVDEKGEIDKENFKILYMSNKSLKKFIWPYIKSIEFVPAEHHRDCYVPQALAFMIEFE